MGGTHVLCGVSIEDKVPPFLIGTGKGWITAEYGMLPCATHTRGRREAVSGVSGRTYEIQRLIGSSLRMMIDLKKLGEYTLRVDCDVLNADGGTRCASITGAALALRQALATHDCRRQADGHAGDPAGGRDQRRGGRWGRCCSTWRTVRIPPPRWMPTLSWPRTAAG